MGFDYGNKTVGSHFGNINSIFSMNTVICNEGDETIQECTFKTSETCGPDQIAGVICNNNNPPGKLQLSPD